MYGLEKKNEIRVMGETRTLMSTRKLMGGPVPGACLFARADFLQRQSDVAQALSDAVVHALKWLQTAGLTDILKRSPHRTGSETGRFTWARLRSCVSRTRWMA